MELLIERGYRFPAFDEGDKGGDSELLLDKLEEEVREAAEALDKYTYAVSGVFRPSEIKNMRKELCVELFDVMHVCETMLHKLNVGTDEMTDLTTYVTLKNKLRGYYGSCYD